MKGESIGAGTGHDRAKATAPQMFNVQPPRSNTMMTTTKELLGGGDGARPRAGRARPPTAWRRSRRRRWRRPQPPPSPNSRPPKRNPETKHRIYIFCGFHAMNCCGFSWNNRVLMIILWAAARQAPACALTLYFFVIVTIIS